MSILGTRVVRTEDPRLLTVGGTYVDDLRVPELEGAVQATFVRSPLAHAVITGIDTSVARDEPGVLAVLTAQDLGPSEAPENAEADEAELIAAEEAGAEGGDAGWAQWAACSPSRCSPPSGSGSWASPSRWSSPTGVTRAKTPPNWSAWTTTRCPRWWARRHRSPVTPCCSRRPDRTSPRPAVPARAAVPRSTRPCSRAARWWSSGRSSTSGSPRCRWRCAPPRRSGRTGS